MSIDPAREQSALVPKFPAEWNLAPGLADSLERTLGGAGFSAELAHALAARVERGAQGGDARIIADKALLDRFSAGERLRWWLLLATHSRNRTYRWPVAFPPSLIGELSSDPAFSEAAARLRRWSVRYAEQLLFCDMFALEDAFTSDTDRAAFFRRILRADMLIVRLTRDGASGAEDWSSYWQVNGRYRALAPFFDAIESIEEIDRVEVAHILPRLPRALLNSYPPDFTSQAEPSVETAAACANFFALEPEKQDPMPAGFSRWLKTECAEISADVAPVFGDIVVFGDVDRSDWPYAVVYVSDGVVFGRRPTLLGPWGLMRRAEIPRLNPRLALLAPRLFRRKSTSGEISPAPFVRRARPGAWKPVPALREAAPGPWGRLRYYDILLAPGGDILDQLPVPERRPQWVFKGLEPDDVSDGIQQLGMEKSVRDELIRLFAQAQVDEHGFLSVRPSLELARRTPREFRDRFFRQLVHGDRVDAYAQEIAIPTALDPAVWFSPDTLPRDVRDVVLRLTYRRGAGLMLSDYGALFHSVGDPIERNSTLRTVTRTPALIVMLEKPARDEISAVADYWRLGQGMGVSRILDAFEQSTDLRFLDIVHLLPPLPREFMNLYAAQRADLAQASCYWTAMNFGSERYDPAFLVPPSPDQTQLAAVRSRLDSEYEEVREPYRFGDVIAYRKLADPLSVIHVCSYVAADIVFTKNGYGYLAPWCLMHQSDVDALYLDPAQTERLGYRRRH